MFKSRFFWKLFLSYALIVLATVGAVGFLVLREYRRDLGERMETSLFNQCVGVGSLMDWREDTIGPDGTAARLLRIAQDTNCRLTVIQPDGQVLIDSEADPSIMVNHADRGEIQRARATGKGVERRVSQTVGREYLYVAYSPGADEGRPGGVIRMSVELESIDEATSAVASQILVGGGLASILALLVGAFVVRRVTRPLDRMRQVAAALGEGDYAARVPVKRAGGKGDELAELATALNRLGFDMSQRVADLTAGQERLRAMVAGMIEGVVAVDEDDRITFSNYAARRLLHLGGRVPATEAEKRSKLPVWDHARAPGLDALVASARRTDAAAQCELELQAHPGAPTSVVRAQAHRFQDGDTVGVVVVLQDISEIRKLESVRRDFVANVSHELKTPLTSIRGYVETLLDGAIHDEGINVRFLEKIEKNVLRLNHLVTDLLSLARIESESGFLHLSPVDLHFVVEEALRRHEQSAIGRDQKLIAEHCNGSVRVLADSEAITQIVDNLIDNGLKYSPDRGVVKVTVRRVDEEAILEVQDDGVGIPEEDQARIFERFYRVDKARSREVGGTGLGLSIVKHLAGSMEGRVELESAPGGGSTFRVFLKLAD